MRGGELPEGVNEVVVVVLYKICHNLFSNTYHKGGELPEGVNEEVVVDLSHTVF